MPKATPLKLIDIAQVSTVQSATGYTAPTGGGASTDADKVDSFDAYSTPVANALLALDASAQFPTSVFALHTALPNAHHNQAHVLATQAALGGDHTVSGATAGHVLRASAATAANFQQLVYTDLPTRTLTAGDGLTGGGDLSADRAFAVNAGDGIDLVADAVAVDVTDFIDTAYGLTEDTNNIRVNAGAGLTFATDALVPDWRASASASVNLTSANSQGAAATVARGDHWHALDVSIAPTWSGVHHFGADVFIDTGIGHWDVSESSLYINPISALPDFRGALTVRPSATTQRGFVLQQYPGQTNWMMQFLDAASPTPNNLILLSNQGDLESGNPGFVSGQTGWQINHLGNAEFNDLVARGEFHCSVFVADEMHATGGTLAVLTSFLVAEPAGLNLVTGWTNADAPNAFETFSSSGSSISSAINTSGAGNCTFVYTAVAGAKYRATFNAVVTTGVVTFRADDNVFAGTVKPGPNVFTFTGTTNGSRTVWFSTAAAANFSISVFRLEQLAYNNTLPASVGDTCYFNIDASYATGLSYLSDGDVIRLKFMARDAAAIPNLVTAWASDGTYVMETLTTNGAEILSAINSSGEGSCLCTYTAVAGAKYRVSFNLTLNSGVMPALWADNQAFVGTPQPGPNVFTFTGTTSGARVISFFANDASSFSVSGFEFHALGMDLWDVYLQVSGTPVSLGNADLANGKPGTFGTTCVWKQGGSAGLVIPTKTGGVKWGHVKLAAEADYTGGIILTSDLTNNPYIDIFTNESVVSGSGGTLVAPWTPLALKPRMRMGNLKGLGGISQGAGDQWGLAAGSNLAAANLPHIVMSDLGCTMYNVTSTWYDAGGNAEVQIGPMQGASAAPYFAMGSTLPTGVFAPNGSGVWMGMDPADSIYKFRVGTITTGALSAGMSWDGSTLTVKGTVYATAGLIGGWTLSSTAISNSTGQVVMGAAGNLAFGYYDQYGDPTLNIPTSSSTGTGLWIDYTGIYGLNATVKQAIFDATTGAITAGVGAVVLNVNGIQIAQGSGTPNKLQFGSRAQIWQYNAGGDVEAWMWTQDTTPVSKKAQSQWNMTAGTHHTANMSLTAGHTYTDSMWQVVFADGGSQGAAMSLTPTACTIGAATEITGALQCNSTIKSYNRIYPGESAVQSTCYYGSDGTHQYLMGGPVIIGATTAPQGTLDVQSAVATTSIQIVGTLSAGAHTPSLIMHDDRGGGYAGIKIRGQRDTSSGGHSIIFSTTADNAAEVAGSYSDRLTIDRGGSITAASLAGSGNRAVYADSNGKLYC